MPPTINPFNNQVLAADVLFNGGTFGAGTDGANNTISIGTGSGGTRVIVIGSNNAGAFTINTGPGNLAINSNGNTINLGNNNGIVNIASAGTATVNIGSAAATAVAIVGTANINTTGAAVTEIGVGGTGAVNIGNATGDTTIPAGDLVVTSGNILATAGNIGAAAGFIIATVGEIRAGGDIGGSAGTTSLTDTALGTGAGVVNTVTPSGATGAKASNGYIKFYVGTAVAYVPYWTDPS